MINILLLQTKTNLITKTDFDATFLSLNRKNIANKLENLLVENELKKKKHLIQVILLAKVIFKKMVHKII